MVSEALDSALSTDAVAEVVRPAAAAPKAPSALPLTGKEALVLVGEAGSIGRGGYGPFAGRGPDRSCWCRRAPGMLLGVGHSLPGCKYCDMGIVVAAAAVVTGVVAAGCTDRPFDLRWVRGRPGQGPERGRSLAVFGHACDPAGYA